MSIKTYNTPPYYDDFDQSKNYMRVLFRPGYSVQARELTQMQTAIQAQLDRFGSNIFKDGSAVVGGKASLDNAYAYVKIYSSFTYSGSTVGGITNGTALIPDNYYEELIGTTITGQTTGVTAKVVNATPAITSGDPLTIFVKYTSSGTDTTTKVFAPGEYLLSDGDPVRLVQVKNLLSVDTTNGDNYPTGYGTNISVSEGAFFVSGNFVYARAQSIILSKYTTNPSARIVYRITESVVTSADDSTLTDNALGSPNVAAPGANRYAIDLQLIVQPIEFAGRTENNIIQLLVVVNGIVNSPANDPYSAIGDTMAERTFEEAGNFVVNPFLLNIREYLNTGTNGGLFTTDQIISAGNAVDTGSATAYGKSKLAVGVEKSTAYVDGYRIQLVDTKYIPVNKARDEGYAHEVSLVANIGNSFQITNIVGVPDINTFAQITLKNSSSITVGYARARSIEYVSGSGSSAIYNLYIFDLQMLSTYGFGSVHTVYSSYGTGVAFTATAVDSTPALSGGNNSMLFSLPRSVAQSLLTDGQTYTFYSVKKRYDPNPADGSGNVTLTPISNEIFYSIDTVDYLVVKNSDGSIVPQTAAPTLTSSGGGSVVTVTLHLGSGNAGTSVHIIAPSSRNIAQKTKTLQTNQEIILDTPNTTPGGYDLLNVTDLLSVSGIYMSANLSTDPTTADTNVTSRYYIDNGQRDNFYDVARIQLIPGQAAPTGRLLVVYSYLQHGAGDYFSVDSYTGVIDYENIPSFQSSQGLLQLRDVLDFRPTKDTNTGGFTGTGASLVSMVIPNTTVTCDIHYYLPRIDKIYVDKKGNFSVVEGVSADVPVAPADPDGTMILYTLNLSAYTFTTQGVSPKMIDNRRYTMRDIGSLDSRLKNVEYYTALSLLENSTAATQIIDPNTGTPYYQHGFVVDSFSGSSVGNVSNPDYSVSIESATGTCRPSFFEDNVKLKFNSSLSSGVMQTGSLLTLEYYESDYIKQPYASNTMFVNPFDVFNWTGDLQLTPSTDDWKDTVQAPDVVINDTGVYDSVAAQLQSSGTLGTVWNDWQTTWAGTSTSSTSAPALNQIESLVLGVTATATTTTTTTTTNQVQTGTVTSLSSTVNTQNYGNMVVDVSIVPFIRSRTVYFWASGLKPNTTVYPFFDSTSVSAYCSQLTPSGTKTDYWNSLQYSSSSSSGTGPRPLVAASGATSYPGGSTPLVTDSAGDVFGAFLIPNNSSLQFKTGTRIFRVCDSATNNLDLVTTSAEASYTAQGLLDTVSNLIVSTQTPVISTSQVSQSRVLTNVSSSQTISNVVNTQPPTFPPPTTGTTPPYTLPVVTQLVLAPFQSTNGDVTTVLPATNSGPGSVSVPSNYTGSGTETIGNTDAPVVVSNPTNTTPIDVGGGGASEVPGGLSGLPVINPGQGAPIYYLDPLAQSFLIDMQGGIMATSIDIYFEAKDPSLPVTLSIVTMENGSPTQTTLPFSTVTLPAASVSTSVDATSATTFKFASPVYLLQGVEYAFVLHSNSNLYKVWISQLGNYDVTNTSYRITEQPYAGVLFESQNSSTWTPNQTADMKFLIRRAVFNTADGTVVMNETTLPAAQLIVDPLYFTSGYGTVKVYHANHGLFAGSSVTLSGIVANSGSAINGIPITQLNTTLTVTSVEIDSYTVNVAGTATVTGRAGGTAVTATENKPFDVMHPNIQDIVMSDTNIAWSAKTTSGKSLAGSETPYTVGTYQTVKANDNTFMNNPQTIAGTPNIGYLSDRGSYSFYLEGNISSTRNNISPIIDLDRCSLVTVSNRIDNPTNTNPAPSGYNYVIGYLPDSAPVGGSGLSKYLTKQITLENPAESLSIMISMNQPSNSNIAVYYKVPSPTQQDTSFDSLSWNLAVPDYAIPISDDPTVYKDVTYTVTPAEISAALGTSSTVSFSSFAVKIVFYSQNSSKVPTIRNFRTIALS